MNDFYNLSQTLQGSIYGALFRLRQKSGDQPAPPSPLLQVQGGYAESPAWYLVQAMEFDPEPLTVANVRVRDIYASERIVAAILDLLTAAGMLDRTLDGAYYLTESGREMAESLFARSAEPLSNLNAQLTTDVDRLAALLGRIVESWLRDGDRDSWSLAHSRNRAPAADAAALRRINQFCADFNAYRDDAHMAAWRKHGLEGIVWETFDFVLNGQANSAESLFQSLAYRGYATAEFANFLTDLTQRGWIEAADAGYQATELGRSVRESAETATDYYFYAVWSQLPSAEIDALWSLMNQLNDELQAIAA